MGNSKELVNLSLQDIVQPIDQLGPNSLIFGSLLQTHIHSPPQSPPQIMDGNVNAIVAPMNYNPPPKFYLREGIYVDDHLQSLFLALEILAVEHEDVVCRFFPHTFKDKESTWYFGLPTNSIMNWDTFEILFKGKFGSRRTDSALMKELFSLRMDKKEKV